MWEEKSLNECKEEYVTLRREYMKMREDSETPGIEVPKIELKTRAQKLLSYALALKDRFEDLGKYQDKVDFFNSEIKSRKAELVGYGSAMSDIPKTTFEDVAGLEDVKATINDYLFALMNPDIAERYRIDTNIGLLMYGPPGTGKTMVAEAVANRLNVRFFTITPSQIFGSYVGESERNVRELFEELRACENGAVVLIDECEAIFGKRTGNSDRSSIGVANQLLQEMNGVKDTKNSKRVMIGATNRPEMIDPAYLRYKRFSRHYLIGMPNDEARGIVIDHKMKKLPHEPMVIDEMKETFDETYTCADISNVIEQCAYQAMSEYRLRKEVDPTAQEVKIGSRHFRQIMSHFERSVTPSMLKVYEDFREQMRNNQ